MILRRVLVLLCACICFWAMEARADEAADTAEAERLFKAGISLQKAADFDAAIAAFESSLRLHPTKSALFNLANCLQAVHRYPDALATLERLENEYGAELEEPMRGRVAIQRAELENLTASLTLNVEPQGAEVHVDGRLVGTAPLGAPLRLSLGDHEIEVKLADYASDRRSVNLAPNEKAVQTFELKPTTPPEVVPAPAPRPEPATSSPSPLADSGPTGVGDRSSNETTSWVLLGTGGALVVAGTVTGIMALSLDGQLSKDCWDGHCPGSKQDDVDRLDRLTLATNVLLGLGLAGAATGAVMLLLQDHGDEAANDTDVHFMLAPGYAGAGLKRTF